MHLFKLPSIFATTGNLIAVLLLMAACQLPSTAQGGYDTTDFSKPDENRERPDPYAEDGRASGERAPLPAVGDLEKWFAQYDGIRRKYENTPEERQYFESLASKPPGSGLSEDDYKFLTNLSNRYAEAFGQLREVEPCSETQHLHRSYAIFLSEQSNLYNDYIRILSEPNARDQKTGRPLAATMSDRRRNLYTLEKSTHLMDVKTRRAFNVSRNPYERQAPEE